MKAPSTPTPRISVQFLNRIWTVRLGSDPLLRTQDRYSAHQLAAHLRRSLPLEKESADD